MPLYRLSALILPFLLLPASAPGEDAPEEAPPLVLELCAGQVASADLLQPRGEGGSFGVAIRLLPEAAESFAALTRDHRGRWLEVRIGRGYVVRARIQQPILSGVITTRGHATREEAEEVRAAALASRARICRSPGPPGAAETPGPDGP